MFPGCYAGNVWWRSLWCHKISGRCCKNDFKNLRGYFKEQSSCCFKVKLRYTTASVSGCVWTNLRWVTATIFSNTSPISLTGCGSWDLTWGIPQFRWFPFIAESMKTIPTKELSDYRGFGENIGVVRDVVECNFLLIEHYISWRYAHHIISGLPEAPSGREIVFQLDGLEALISTRKLMLGSLWMTDAGRLRCIVSE